MIAAVLSVVSVVCVAFIRESVLRTRSGDELARDQERALRADAPAAAGPL